MKNINWIYCFADKKQNVTPTNQIGLIWYGDNNYDKSTNFPTNFLLNLEREDVDEFTFEENLQYSLGMLNMIHKYCDAYFAVTKKDLTYAVLKFDYKLMLLIDSNKKKEKIKKITKEIFWQWYDLKYPSSDDDVTKLQIKYDKRKEKLKQQILKFNVIK